MPWVTLTQNQVDGGLFAARQNNSQIYLEDNDSRVVAFLQANPRPIPTGPLTLETAKTMAIRDVQRQTDAFVAKFFTTSTMSLLTSIYSQAGSKSLKKRLTYLEPLIDWGNSVAAVAESVGASVAAAATIAEVNIVMSMPLQFPAPPDPLPSRAGAMAINS